MTIEVGTNSYISITDADAYHVSMGYTDWDDLDDSEKEILLIRATKYIESNFAGKWVGVIEIDTQLLSWPRYSAYDAEGRLLEGIPTLLEDGCAYLALQANTTELFSTSGRDQGKIREKIGPLDTEWSETARSRTTYNYVSDIFSPLLISGSATGAGQGVVERSS